MRWQKKIAAERDSIQSSVKQASINSPLSFGKADPYIEIVNLLFLVPEQQIDRSEEHTSELQSHSDLVCRLLLEKKKISSSQTARRSRSMRSSNLSAGS